jgi:predicted RNA-binding protein with PIN domain
MRYAVDGHNLIPKVGLSLAAVDDEADLVQLLQEFSRTSRARIEVFFDGAPGGHAATRRLGTIVAHFVPAGTTADSAIAVWLRALHGAARDWTVVSSDLEVQRMAKRARAPTISSEDFATLLADARRQGKRALKGGSAKGEPPMTKDELEQWLAIFDKRR